MKWLLALNFTLVFAVLPAQAKSRFMSKAELIQHLTVWETSLSSKNIDAREKDLQKEMIHRFKFQIERKYTEQEANKFFLKTIEDMREVDDLKLNRSYASYTEFLLNLEDAIKDLYEPGENIVNFVMSYTDYSSIKKPKDSSGFSEQRNYFNGKVMQSGQPLSLDEAGEVADKKLKEREIEIPDYLKTPVHFENDFAPLSKSSDISFN